MGSKEIAEPIRGNVKDMYEMKRQQYKLELEKKEQRLKTNFISKGSLGMLCCVIVYLFVCLG